MLERVKDRVVGSFMLSGEEGVNGEWPATCGQSGFRIPFTPKMQTVPMGLPW